MPGYAALVVTVLDRVSRMRNTWPFCIGETLAFKVFSLRFGGVPELRTPAAE